MSVDSVDERLRRALLDAEDDGSTEIGALDLVRVQRAVAGELPRAELDELLARAIAEPALARAWRLARELRAGLGPETGAPARTSRSWLWGSAAAAALAAALVVLAVRTPRPEVERGNVAPTIRATVADSAPLPRNAFRLTWEPLGEGVRYDLDVLGPELELIDRATDLEAPAHSVPGGAFAGLESGALVYWRVEAWLPGGERVASPTFVQSLE